VLIKSVLEAASTFHGSSCATYELERQRSMKTLILTIVGYRDCYTEYQKRFEFVDPRKRQLDILAEIGNSILLMGVSMKTRPITILILFLAGCLTGCGKFEMGLELTAPSSEMDEFGTELSDSSAETLLVPESNTHTFPYFNKSQTTSVKNDVLGFSVEVPSVFVYSQIDFASGEFGYLDSDIGLQRMTFRLSESHPTECQGCVPDRIIELGSKQIGSTRVERIKAVFGGEIHEEVLMYVYPWEDQFIAFSLHAVNQYETGVHPEGIWRLADEDIRIFEEILATLQFDQETNVMAEETISSETDEVCVFLELDEDLFAPLDEYISEGLCQPRYSSWNTATSPGLFEIKHPGNYSHDMSSGADSFLIEDAELGKFYLNTFSHDPVGDDPGKGANLCSLVGIGHLKNSLALYDFYKNQAGLYFIMGDSRVVVISDGSSDSWGFSLNHQPVDADQDEYRERDLMNTNDFECFVRSVMLIEN
jgi:hypothetical protein